jgi:hypothetical protein
MICRVRAFVFREPRLPVAFGVPAIAMVAVEMIAQPLFAGRGE